ncbi:MAG TPA: hypothetical protein VFV71_10710, partial [Burkholderiales bacterium]|nr:hypothetical protein [Burkholderiales bacterium]
RDRLRIELAHAGAPVANAELLTGPFTALPRPAPFTADPASRHFPEPRELLPHAPPMRLLAAIREWTPRGLRGTGLVPAACALATGGAAPALAAVEAAAQAAAAWEALMRRQEGGDASPRIGYLVGLRDVTLCRASLPAECEFTVAAELEEVSLPLTRYRIEAALDGTTVAKGSIATYLAGPAP